MPTGLELLAAAYAPKKPKHGHSPQTDMLGNEEPVVEETTPPVDELLPKNRGAFMSALNWIGRPGQVVKNTLTGNFEGALRQGADFLGDAVDAVLPGDWIPEASRPQDEVQGSALLGLDDAWRKEHPLLNAAVSLPVDIVTDPLTWTGFGPLAKAAGKIGQGAEAVARQLPRGAETVQAAKDIAAATGKGLRSIVGEQKLAKPIADAAQAASATKFNVAAAGADQAAQLFKGFTEQELNVAGDVADGLLHDAASRPIAPLRGDSLLERIANHPDAKGMDPTRIENLVNDAKAFMQRQGTEGGLGQPAASVSDLLSSGGRTGNAAPDLPIFTPGPGVSDYLPRLYKGETEEDALAALVGDTTGTGVGKATSERTLLTPSAQIEYFAKNPKLTNVRNLAERIGNRVGQQAELGKRAELGRAIIAAVKAGEITIPDSELRGLAAMVEPDAAVRLGSNTAADIAPKTASPGDTLFNAGLGGQSGKSLAPTASAPVDLVGNRIQTLDEAGTMGAQSGKSRPPRRSQEGGDPTGLGPGPGEEGPMQWSPEMGTALPSGVTKVPVKGNAPVDLLGGIVPKASNDLVNPMSGISRPPRAAASGLDLLGGAGPKIGADVYGVGEQSGKAVVGGTQAPVRQAISPMASLVGGTKTVHDLAKTVDQVMTHDFRLADPRSRQIVNAAIKGLDPESAKYAHDMFNGLPPRGGVMQALSKVNRVIKPMMVYGFAIPKMGAMVRNVVSGSWQAFSNPATRGTAWKQMTRIPSSLYGAVVDSLGLKVGKDELGKVIATYDQALKGSGGIASKALAALEAGPGVGGFTGKQIADVFRSGATGGFVDTEAFLKTMAGTPWKQKYKEVVEWPARMFKGLEDRMRIGMGLELAKEGKPIADIGRFTQEALYNYDVSSAGNRAARDVLPFAQFTFKAVPQQAKLLYEKPWLAVGMSSLLTEKEGQPVYPYMEGKLNVPLGANDKGEQQYASGFGLPFEALSQIPNLSGTIQESGRDLERILGGSSQPLLKTAFGVVSGEDPYFETPFGSYSKLPGNVEGGALGRAYNIFNGAGVIQPLDAPLRLIGKVADTRQSAPIKGLDLLTGANVVTVDEDRALQQRLTDYLRRNPEVSSFESLYSKSNDPEVKALLKQLRDAKKRIKAKKAAP